MSNTAKEILLLEKEVKVKGKYYKGMKEGFCCVLYSDGNEYRGFFSRNMKNGYGILKFQKMIILGIY